MPFSTIERPAIGISLLAAAAKNAGLKAGALYPCFDFAEKIGLRKYYSVSQSARSLFLGEWIFASSAFRESSVPGSRYLNSFIKGELDSSLPLSSVSEKEKVYLLNDLKNLRNLAGSFIESTAYEIIQNKPRIVGCTSAFMQHNASLALLRRLKELDPSIVTMLGGPNCDGEMGLVNLRNFPWVDFVVSGEADEIFPELCEKILCKGSNLQPEELPYGVYNKKKLIHYCSGANNGQSTETAIYNDLENSLLPDYDDYFDRLNKSVFYGQIKPILVMESSRGCWKGQRSQCNFCGLNGARNISRNKSDDKVMKEFEALKKKHNGISSFFFTDTILKMSYFKGLIKNLAGKNKPYRIYFEVTSNLNSDNIKMLSDAGINWVQAGIENLNDNLLKFLNKGNSTLNNIAFLKHSKKYGINVFWNILHSFPGDKEEYYREMAELIPLIYHLQPPCHFTPVRFERFSPFVEDQERFGLSLSPVKCYSDIYPLDKEEIYNLACCFHDEKVNRMEKGKKAALENLNNLVLKWKRSYFKQNTNGEKTELTAEEHNEILMISDTRPCAVSSEFRLTGLDKKVYLICSNPKDKTKILSLISSGNIPELKVSEIEKSLKKLVENKLLISTENKYLSLAVTKPVREMPDVTPFTCSFKEDVSLKNIIDPVSEKNLSWNWFN